MVGPGKLSKVKSAAPSTTLPPPKPSSSNPEVVHVTGKKRSHESFDANLVSQGRPGLLASPVNAENSSLPVHQPLYPVSAWESDDDLGEGAQRGKEVSVGVSTGEGGWTHSMRPKNTGTWKSGPAPAVPVVTTLDEALDMGRRKKVKVKADNGGSGDGRPSFSGENNAFSKVAMERHYEKTSGGKSYRKGFDS